MLSTRSGALTQMWRRWDGDRLTPPSLSLTVEQSYADLPLNPRNSSLPVVGRGAPSAKKGSGADAAAGKSPSLHGCAACTSRDLKAEGIDPLQAHSCCQLMSTVAWSEPGPGLPSSPWTVGMAESHKLAMQTQCHSAAGRAEVAADRAPQWGD